MEKRKRNCTSKEIGGEEKGKTKSRRGGEGEEKSRSGKGKFTYCKYNDEKLSSKMIKKTGKVTYLI